MKHNKKRNTAFLFETLINEMTKAVVHGDLKKQAVTRKIISKHFRKGSSLYKELQLYRAIVDTRGLDRILAEKLIFEVKAQRRYILDSEVFQEQSELISDMNQEYTKGIFANFVPNYKDLATLAQLFNSDMSVKEKVLLEGRVIEYLVSEEKQSEDKMQPIDNFTYKTFVQKFNEKYSNTLLKEQRRLLQKYISSFSNNGLELKIFLNEEIGRLKGSLDESLKAKEIAEDKVMRENTERIISELNGYAKKQIDTGMIQALLKIQHLVQELDS